MAVMKVRQFVETALRIEQSPTVYYSVSAGAWCKWNGKSWNMDCVCMIKGILWGFNFNKNANHGGAIYLSNGVKDDNADGILKRCYNISRDFSHIEYGELMHMEGHVGIYIGNGQVVEATTAWDHKVQISQVGSDGRRSKNGVVRGYWKEHGKLSYVEYETPIDYHKERVKELQRTLNAQYGCGLAVDGSFGPLTSAACSRNYLYKGKKASTHIRWLQKRLIELGYSVGRYGIDGSFGNDTLNAVRQFQRNKGLVVDGYVGKDTSKKLVE